MANIHVRGIPDEIYARVVSIATKKEMSMNKLVKLIIQDYALNPEIKNIEDKYANLVADITALYQAELEKTREQIEENSLLLKQILSQL